MKLIHWTTFVLVCWLAGCSPTATVPAPTSTAAPFEPEVEAEIDHLLGLMRDRLLLMHDVARWKLQENVPITDGAREQAVIEQTVRFAQENRLDIDLGERFMKAQIEAGKQIQEQDLEVWK